MGKQVQRMSTQLKLSPQQMQLMKILQMPATVLEQSIKDEIEKNPLLESEQPADEDLDMAERMDEENEHSEVEDFFEEDDDYGYRASRKSDDDNSPRELNLTADASSVDNLMEQLMVKDLDDREKTIVQELIGSLDDAGYLSRDLAVIENDLAFRQDIECREGEIEHALKVLQSLEPAGVGARNLQECLMLQLRRIKPQTLASRVAAEVVEHYFDQLVQKRYAVIVDKLDIDDEALKDALECIHHLNPKPCGGEDDNEPSAPTVIPDFIVSVAGGRLSVRLNESHTPTLRLNAHYTHMLDEMGRQKNPDRQTIEFLKEKMESANEFINNLSMRQAGLLQTMTAIAKIQRKYLATGDPADLKPLTQKEVAKQFDMDETVMSRIVNQKYVQTDFGVVLMKNFFVQSTTSNADGEDVTTTEIEKHLKEMIDNEDKSNPLTDEQLEDEFKQLGITLARRTIAKYRSKLGIPVGRLRKVTKIVLLVLMLGAGTLMAQEPQSYFDSLIYMQQQSSRKGNSKEGKVRIRQNTDKLDTALLRGDDLLDKMYDSQRPLPSSLWYGNKFSQSRVKGQNYSMDSLPDEVNLRLVKNANEFCFPVKNVKTSNYGWRWNRPHRGVDIALNTGDPVHCAFDGVVRIATVMGGYGNLVVVRHYNGLETVYGHLSKIKVRPMQEVKAGDVIGLGGSTGRTTGPHLHFEVRFQYEPFDPEWILDFKTYSLRTKKLHLDKTYFGISRPSGSKNEVLAYKADKSFVAEQPERDPAAHKPKPLYYNVKKGDNIEDIAVMYKTTVDHIMELNPGVEKIRNGMKLRVR